MKKLKALICICSVMVFLATTCAFSASPSPTAGLTATPAPSSETTAVPTPTPTPTPEPTPTPTPKPLSAKFQISFKAEHGNYNSVGKSWSYAFSMNGKTVNGTQTVTLTEGDTLTFKFEATENDKIPDYESGSTVVKVDENFLTNGKTVTITIYVTENAGRYSGNSCRWTMTATCKRTQWIVSPDNRSVFGSDDATEDGLTVEVTAKSIAIRDASGNVLAYIMNGSKITITGYSYKLDSFIVSYNGEQGYVKGEGFNYSREKLEELF